MITKIIINSFISIPFIYSAVNVSPTSMDDRHEPIDKSPTHIAHRLERRNTESTDIAGYYNREAFIRTQIQELISDEEALKSKIDRSQMCANIWTTSAAITTTFILIVSVIGATDYLDPRIANVVASCGAGLNGLFMWASMQFKKTEKIQLEKQKKIKEALGVPRRLLIQDMSTSFEQFKSP